MQWTGERDGHYRGTFVSTDGRCVRSGVDATRAGGQAVGSSTTYVRAVPSEAEFFDPTMHAAADEAGSRTKRAAVSIRPTPRRSGRRCARLPAAA